MEMMEAVAEEDEELLNRYLETGTSSEEEIISCVRKATISQAIVPWCAVPHSGTWAYSLCWMPWCVTCLRLWIFLK